MLPQFPVALSLSRGGADARGALPSGGGGFPMMVTLSHEGSISESASRSQEDLKPRLTQTFARLCKREADAYLENDTKRAGVEVSDTGMRM